MNPYADLHSEIGATTDRDEPCHPSEPTTRYLFDSDHSISRSLESRNRESLTSNCNYSYLDEETQEEHL